MKEFKTLGPTQFGIGDGSQTRFSVARQGDVISSAHVESVITVGWQGEQLLSPTPRTNLLLASNDFESLAWRGSPSLYDDFSLGPPLDPRFTFSRSTPAWYWKNGVLVEAGIDEPVFEDGALRLEASQTEFIPNNTVLSSTNANWTARKVDDPQIPYAYEFEFVSGTTTGHINTNVPTYPATNIVPSSGQYVIGVAVKKTVNDAFIRSSSSSAAAILVLNTRTGDVVHRGQQSQDKVIDLGGWWLISLTSTGLIASSRQWRIYASDNYVSGSSPSEPSPGHKVVIALPSFRDSLVFDSSPIMTSDSAVTRAADSFSLTGEAFQRVFNPNEGALVFKIGEGSAAPKVILGPLEFDNMQSGEALALAWHNDEFKVFRDGAADGTFTQDMTGADELKFESMYLKSLSLYTTRPTDAEMEALTSA